MEKKIKMCEFSSFRGGEIEKSFLLEYCALSLADDCPTFGGSVMAYSARASDPLDQQRFRNFGQ
jgi:hypothetical protein